MSLQIKYNILKKIFLNLFIKNINRCIMYHFSYLLFTLETFLTRLNSKSVMSRYTRLVNYYSTIRKVLRSRVYTCACMRVSNVNWPHVHSCVQPSRDQRVPIHTPSYRAHSELASAVSMFIDITEHAVSCVRRLRICTRMGNRSCVPVNLR